MKQYRKRLDELYALRFKLWQKLVNVRDFMRGSVVTLYRPCVYRGCLRCKKGEKHPGVYLSVSKKGKTQLVYLSKGIEGKVRQWTSNYRELKEILEEISEINLEIVKILSKR